MQDLARKLLYAGLFASSFLAFRVSSYTIGDILLGLSLSTLLLGGAGRSSLRPDRLIWLALWFALLGGLLATIRSDSAGGSVAIVIRLVYLVAVLPWQLCRLVNTETRLLRAAGAWAAGAAVCALGAVYQAQGGTIPGSAVTNAGRYTGLVQNPSDLGGITAAGAAFFLAGAMSRRRSAFRWCLVGLAACTYGAVLSGSVSAIFAVAVQLVYLILRGRVSFWRAVGTFVGSYVAFTFATSLQKSSNSYALGPIARIKQTLGLSSTVPGQTNLNTSASRLNTDTLGLRGFYQHPLLGRGLDPQSVLVIPDQLLEVHNIVIAAIYSGGIFLGVGLLIPMIRTFVVALRIPRSNAFGGQLASACIAAIVFSMTAPSVFNRYFWIPIGLLTTYQRLSCGESEVRTPLLRAPDRRSLPLQRIRSP